MIVGYRLRWCASRMGCGVVRRPRRAARQIREELEDVFAALKGSRKEINRRLALGERFEPVNVPDLRLTELVAITRELAAPSRQDLWCS
jgi:hypothetical protein